MVKMDWQSARLLADEIADLVEQRTGISVAHMIDALADLLNDHDGQEWDGLQWVAVPE